MKFFVETFGCQMNVADSEAMSRHLSQRGFILAQTKEEAELVLLNTCTVRQHAEDKALSFIGRMKAWKKNNPKGLFIAAGCAAERLKNSLKKRFPHIDLVVGAKEIEKFPEMLDALIQQQNRLPQSLHSFATTDKKRDFNWFEESELSFENGNSREEGEPLVLGENGRTAFVTIMRGCNYSCAYCIVPLVRGREIYRRPSQILSEVRRKVEEGAREIMLLGQTVNSYWEKLEVRSQKSEAGSRIFYFSDLLIEINKIEGVESIKFMSPHPHYMTAKLIRTLSACKKISPEIHLPVQSGSNKILKAMKRNYSSEEYLEIAKKLRNAIPSLHLTTDFIVGFPGETEEDFQKSLALFDAVEFSSAFCFKYSARAGTESSGYPDDVPLTIKEERLSRMLEKIEESKNEKSSKCFAV